MKASHEVHGLDVIRRIASEGTKKEEYLRRVWSEDQQCWGLLVQPPTDHDILMIMGAAQPGDRFLPQQRSAAIFLTKDLKPIFDFSTTIPYVVLGCKQFELDGVIVVGLELLLSTPMSLCYWACHRKFLFDVAWHHL